MARSRYVTRSEQCVEITVGYYNSLGTRCYFSRRFAFQVIQFSIVDTVYVCSSFFVRSVIYSCTAAGIKCY